MLFNSYEFIFFFLPITFFIYFYLNKKGLKTASKAFLVFASLFFYSWWNIIYLPLILISILFNYSIGTSLYDCNKKTRKLLLTMGIIANLSLLGYFKYADFFIKNVNFTLDTHLELLHLMLPLAISFFTFQQIAYLVDSYKCETREYDFLNYAVFVSFFPQLIAGPIVHHKEMMPQFMDSKNDHINHNNIALGLSIFAIGLFKKVIIADTFAVWAAQGFDVSASLSFFEAWFTSLSYTFQLYYDFSGYTDMAIGAALLFNIKLPINFNSPYKAKDIQDFWRRWHITLSRFLRDYIYIPLGGNRKGSFKTYNNLMATFVIGGLWHGAGWTFVFWGFLHGAAIVIHRIWNQLGMTMNGFLAWFITFNFVNFTWVFFRAQEWGDAIKVLEGMAGLNGFELPYMLQSKFAFLSNYGVEFSSCCGDKFMVPMIVIFFFVSVFGKNSMEFAKDFQPTFRNTVFVSSLFAFSTLFLMRVSEFLYFNF